jgi:hypothetical protein
MSPDDFDYLEGRAELELALAQSATHAEAVRAHYELASAYLDRIHGETPQKAPNLFDF